MKKYNKFDIDRVKSAADIRDFIPGLSGRGATQYCECPECHKSGRNKGLCVTHKTNMDIAKCFSCGFTINGAIDAVQYYDKVEFIDALQLLPRDTISFSKQRWRNGSGLSTEAERK